MVDNFDGALAQRETGPELLDGLRSLSRREGTTLFVTLMAGLLALLHRYTGQTDLVVGTASANRGREELAPLIGYLVNALPIRADAVRDPPSPSCWPGSRRPPSAATRTRTCRSASWWRRLAWSGTRAARRCSSSR